MFTRSIVVGLLAMLLVGGCPQDVQQPRDSQPATDAQQPQSQQPESTGEVSLPEEPESPEAPSEPNAAPDDSVTGDEGVAPNAPAPPPVDGAEEPPDDPPSEPVVETALIWGETVGNGSIYIDPVGIGDPLYGFLYPIGTEVTLTAVAANGWMLVGWGGDIDSEELTVTLTLEDEETWVFALFIEPIAPPPPIYFEAVVIAADGQFLGVINDNPFDPDSLANPFGTYGNTFSSLSIWNDFGQYGGSFGAISAYNSFSSSPPAIFIGNEFQMYLTKNAFMSPRLDPDELAASIGRYDVFR